MYTYIIELCYFALFFAIVIIGLALVCKVILKRNEKNHYTNMAFLGFFMQLENKELLSLSLLFLRYLWILYYLLFPAYINPNVFSILLFLSIAFGLSSRSVKNLIIEVISSVAIYFALICSMLLKSYLFDVIFDVSIATANIGLRIFIFIYSSYFLLRNINYTISSNRYIRRIHHED